MTVKDSDADVDLFTDALVEMGDKLDAFAREVAAAAICEVTV